MLPETWWCCIAWWINGGMWILGRANVEKLACIGLIMGTTILSDVQSRESEVVVDYQKLRWNC